MKVEFSIIGKHEQADIIADEFFYDDKYLSGRFAQFVAKNFGIDISALYGKTQDERRKIVLDTISPQYDAKLGEMKSKIKPFQKIWNGNEKIINDEFIRIFGSNAQTRICKAKIALGRPEPRFYSDWSFLVSSEKLPALALDNCIHEITHFLWFDKFKLVFPNWKPSDFCAPSVPWLLSEIAVDPIVKSGKFKNLTREKCAYEYFYDETIQGRNLIECFRELYAENSPDDFMRKGLEILKKEKELTKRLLK